MSVDRNLFYNVKRAGLIGPQLRGGQVILDLQAKEQLPRSAPGGRGDQNLFFRIKARITPTLQKRIIGDLDPLTRIIGQIPRTLKERQAAGVLNSLQVISGVLVKFLTTTELNPDGTPKLDVVTGLPIIKLRSLGEILKVSHEAVSQAFKSANVKAGQNINVLINNFSSQDAAAVIDRFQSIEITNPSQEVRNTLYPDVIVKQTLRKEQEEEKIPEKVDQALNQVINNQDIHDDPVMEFGKSFISPQQWSTWGLFSDQQLAVKQFVRNKLMKLKRPFVMTVFGVEIPSLGLEFSKGHFLDLNELQFKDKDDVPPDERGPDVLPVGKPPLPAVIAPIVGLQ